MTKRTFKITKQPSFLKAGWNLHLYENDKLLSSHFYELTVGDPLSLYNMKSSDWSLLTANGEGIDFVERNWFPRSSCESINFVKVA